MGKRTPGLTKDKKPVSAAERAVTEFQNARQELNAFLSDETVRDIITELHHLVEIYNSTLDGATRAVKNELKNSDQNSLVIQGIGAQKRIKRWYDTEYLANTLPAKQANLFMTEKVIYEINMELLEKLSRQGEIDNEVLANAFHEEQQAPAVLPGTPKPFFIPDIPIDEQ